MPYVPNVLSCILLHIFLFLHNLTSHTFLYCSKESSVLTALHSAKSHSYRLSKYLPFQKEVEITNFKFPLAVSDVVKFEKLYATIFVNVLAFENRSSYINPINVTSFKGCHHHVNLLLIVDDKTGKSHYALIRNMSRLVNDRLKRKTAHYYCDNCLHGFMRQDLLDNHVKECKKYDFQKIKNHWFKLYIDFNTERRKDAKSEFEKNFFKLMNYSVFGKTMENVRNLQGVKLEHNAKQFKKLTAKPNFKSFKIFTEDLTAVHIAKQDILSNKPTYIGMSLLDI